MAGELRSSRQSTVPITIPLLIAGLLLALALRLAPWGQNRFLEDEALYAYWGLEIATGTDPMLDQEPVDKPPLHPYTLAISFLLTSPQQAGGTEEGGAHESAARLPSLLASLSAIALLFALGQALYGDQRVGLVAALLLALSSFDLLFASTAFTDPMMTAFVLGALLAAAGDRLGLAGLLAGLAAATKQQGLVFLPLIVVIGVISRQTAQRGSPDPRPSRASRILAGLKRLWRQPWLRFALGFALIIGAVLWWDAARLQHPGFLEQSLISYGGLGPAQPSALGQRAVEWLRLVASFWVSPWANALLFGAIVTWLVAGPTLVGDPILVGGPTPVGGWWAGVSKIDLALACFCLAFVLLHWLVGFQVWDRYLLGLLPLFALLAARALVGLGTAIRATSWRRVYAIVLGALLAISLAGPVLHAARSELPLGGDHGAYDGIDHLATYMRTQAPPGSVLYHYWLGYHYRFYLHGAPLRLHWYPGLDDLAHDAYVYRREPRYIAFPSWRDGAPAEAALAAAGIALEPVYETVRRDGTVSFRLYRLQGP
jgi:hypothetical protein